MLMMLNFGGRARQGGTIKTRRLQQIFRLVLQTCKRLWNILTVWHQLPLKHIDTAAQSAHLKHIETHAHIPSACTRRRVEMKCINSCNSLLGFGCGLELGFKIWRILARAWIWEQLKLQVTPHIHCLGSGSTDNTMIIIWIAIPNRQKRRVVRRMPNFPTPPAPTSKTTWCEIFHRLLSFLAWSQVSKIQGTKLKCLSTEDNDDDGDDAIHMIISHTILDTSW